MSYKCTNEACRELLDEDAVTPDLGDVGWYFECPTCKHRSPLIDVSLNDGTPVFAQVPWIPGSFSEQS